MTTIMTTITSLNSLSLVQEQTDLYKQAPIDGYI